MSAVAAKQELQTVEPPSAALTPMDMLNQAVERGANIETLDRLMGLQERWEKNQARKEFDAAIAQAKKNIKPVVKNRAGHNTRYADFAAVANAVDGPLSDAGLSYRFRTNQEGAVIQVTCVLSHRAGHSEENTISGPADTSGSKNAIQAIGSTLTYLQRYSLMQAVGLAATVDDDARASDTGELLSAEQVEEMRSEIIERGVNLAKFLKWAKVEKIEDIRATYFDGCMAAIRKAGK